MNSDKIEALILIIITGIISVLIIIFLIGNISDLPAFRKEPEILTREIDNTMYRGSLLDIVHINDSTYAFVPATIKDTIPAFIVVLGKDSSYTLKLPYKEGGKK